MASPDRPLLVGLTGGIASGKSTAANLFADRGVTVIDADIIARKVVEPGAEGLAEVVAEFGKDILDRHGALDRQKLRDRVFADPAAREQLEAILHPRIRRTTFEQLTSASSPYAILVAPLLVETGLHREVDRVLVVDVPVPTQRQRLAARDASSPEQIEQILSAQVSREQRLEAADDVIDNSASGQALAAQVQALHQKYLDLTSGTKGHASQMSLQNGEG